MPELLCLMFLQIQIFVINAAIKINEVKIFFLEQGIKVLEMIKKWRRV